MRAVLGVGVVERESGKSAVGTRTPEEVQWSKGKMGTHEDDMTAKVGVGGRGGGDARTTEVDSSPSAPSAPVASAPVAPVPVAAVPVSGASTKQKLAQAKKQLDLVMCAARVAAERKVPQAAAVKAKADAALAKNYCKTTGIGDTGGS